MLDRREQDWRDGIDHLTSLYREIERRNLALPAVSITPLLVYLWNFIKFELFFFADFFLIIPMNLVIFVRNFFPGRWRYRSFSWKYLKYALHWLWNGEIYVPTIHVRSITRLLLNIHFRRRLKLVRRQILLDNGLSPDTREGLLSHIDRSLEIWPRLTAVASVLTYILPVVGWVSDIFGGIYEDELPGWFGAASLFLITYALAIIGVAFVVKRGLMLGASGRAAYYVGGIDGRGKYEDEGNILRLMGVRAREFPFDALIIIISFVPSLLFQLELQEAGAIRGSSLYLIAVLGAPLIFTIVIVTIGLLRRTKLGRM